MKAFIFDTETTGLPLHRHAKINLQSRIIEFGAVVIDHEGVEHASYNAIIDPQQRIEAIITKITGLTNEDLAGKPLWRDVLPDILKLAEGCDIVIAHNLPFDTIQVDLEMQRLGPELFPWPAIKFCTVQENIHVYGKRPKQTELYEDVMGKPLDQTHRALDDCRALAEIVIKENYIGRIHAAVARKN